jgi:hypothetical protein
VPLKVPFCGSAAAIKQMRCCAHPVRANLSAASRAYLTPAPTAFIVYIAALYPERPGRFFTLSEIIFVSCITC